MSKYTIIVIFIGWALSSFSQEFNTHWICHPLANASSQVFFRHTYITSQQPQKAQLSFISNGLVKVYFNERNISQDITFHNPDSTILALYTYDVTKFLRPDSNTIAVWYAPANNYAVSKQLSLEYYGKDHTGKDFYHYTDGKWLCQELKGCYKHGDKEIFDGQTYHSNWKATDCNVHDWAQPLGPHCKPQPFPITCDTYPNNNYQLHEILYPIATYTDSTGIYYDFGRPFKGTVRLTLRETKKGTAIHIDSFTYICNGEMDEQVFRHFTTSHQRIIHINHDKYFNSSQVVNVEALEYR